MENKIRHLEMIQGVITRMASNSFMIKGWIIGLVAALFAFVPKTNICILTILIVLPIFVLLVLDIYYLHLERIFRNLFDYVRKIDDDNDIDFDMNPNSAKIKKPSIKGAIISKSILPFYIPLIIISVGIIILIAIG